MHVSTIRCDFSITSSNLRLTNATALLFAFLALFWLTSLRVECFDSDKLYKYDFEGAVTTKVADDEKPQYSGLAISSQLLLKKSANDELTVKLDKPTLATFNEHMEDIHLFKFDYKPIERAATLDKPFKIYFESDGSVKSFDTYKDEPKWVTNFKRGLLSFFQLKLKSPDEAQEAEKAATSGQYYTTSEKSVFGACETDYLVMNLAGDDSSSNYLNVTKTRNMAKCKTRFLHRFFPIDSSECVENEKDLQQYKHSNAIFEFRLKGTRQNYVIDQVLLDEVSRFSPFGQKAHSHIARTKFMLKLSKVEDSSESLSPESGSAAIESLSYDPAEMLNFYANINLDEAHHLSNIYQSSASVEQVMNSFEALVQEHKKYTSGFEDPNGDKFNLQENSRLAELFIRLNEQVGTLNSAKIEQLYSQVDERGDAHKKIFWDLMSVVGTNPSFMFMKKLITEGDAPSVKIKDFLTRLSFHIKMPSKSLFDEYVNLCKSDKIQTNQQYKRLCSLPLASLIHQHCVKPHAKYLRMQQEGANATAYKKAQNTCQIATAEEYFTRLVIPTGSSSDSSSELSVGDKMFNVKMAGELGVKSSIDYLTDVAKNLDEHPSLRSAAIWNLIKAARIYPNQVKRLVVPYFYDQNELLELRIAAFQNWFATGLSLHEMETLAQELMREPSRQLVIYVHSMIKSLAESTQIPCGHSSDKNARLVLPSIKQALNRHSAPSMTDSRASFSSQWQPEFGYGTTSFMSTIFSNESLAPSNIFYASSEIMSGLKLTPMMVSVQAHGLDKLIKRVAGISGLLSDKESFMDVFSLKRRSKRQVTSEMIKQEAAEIEKELKLSTRDFSDVYLAVTISAYGRPINFIDRDSRELKKMLSEDGTIKVPQIKKLLHSFNNHTTQQMMITFEKLEVFNNELGLTLYQSINDFDYKTFKLNSVKLDVEPGFFKDERQGKPPTKLSAALDAKMGRHNEMFVSTGALLVHSQQQVGVGFHKKKLVNVPLKLSIDAHLSENKVFFRRQPIHDNLLYIKQQPVTFVKSYDPSSPIAQSESKDSWKPLYDAANVEQMTDFKLDYMTPLAVGVKVQGKHRVGQDWSMASWRRYLYSVGPKAAKFMYFYSPSGSPMEVRVSTATTDENPTKELTSVFSWKHNHEENPEDLSDIDKELEKFTGNEQVSRPTTVSYKLALIGGSSKERKVGVDINYSRSFDKLKHQWRVSYQRTPLDQANPKSEATNLCWTGQTQFPKYKIDELIKFNLLGMEHKVDMNTQLTFGDECAAKEVQSDEIPSVNLKVSFDWSEKQRKMIEAALKGRQRRFAEDEDQELKKNIYLPIYKKCLKKREQTGALLDASCLHLLNMITEMNHISATVDYKDVPERWTKIMSTLGSLYTYARAGYIDEIDDKPHYNDYKSANGKQDRAHLEANLTSLAHDRKLSYEFGTPKYHVVYRNLPISVPPVSTFPLFDASYYQSLQKRVNNRVCSVSGQQVTTFDNFTYTMPSVGDGCFKLITKDCSPENNFVVLGAKVGSGKVLKVYIGQKFKVEFVPDKDGRQMRDIKVNGETVQVKPSSAPLKRETKIGPKTLEAFSIENNSAFYTLSSKLYKFSVSTDGTWILVQQSKYYAGKSCGICGDANGDHLLELKSPSSAKKICKNTNDFVWSYVLPSTCASRPASIECA